MEDDIEDIERLFEDDLNSLDGVNSDDDEDILESSIALWEEMLQAREKESAVDRAVDGDWSNLMQSVEIQTSTWKDIANATDIPSLTRLDNLPTLPVISCVTDATPTNTSREDDASLAETRSSVSNLLHDMLESVEYLQNMLAERRDKKPPSLPTPPADLPTHPMPSLFVEEIYDAPLPPVADTPEVSIVQTMEVADSLLRQQYDVAIEQITAKPNTDEEYKREIEADREIRRMRKLKREDEMRKAQQYRASVLLQSLARGRAARHRMHRIKQIREQIALHELRKQEEKLLRKQIAQQQLDIRALELEDNLSHTMREEWQKQSEEAKLLATMDAESKELLAVEQSVKREPVAAGSEQCRSVSNNANNSLDLPPCPQSTPHASPTVVATNIVPESARVPGKSLVAKEASGWGGVISRAAEPTPVLSDLDTVTKSAEMSIEDVVNAAMDHTSTPYELEGYVFDDEFDEVAVTTVKPPALSSPTATVKEKSPTLVPHRERFSECARTFDDINNDVRRVLCAFQAEIDLPTIQLPDVYLPSAEAITCSLVASPSLWSSWQAWKTYASSSISLNSAPLIADIRTMILTNEQISERFETIENSDCVDMSVEELSNAFSVVDVPSMRVLEMNVNKITTADEFGSCNAQLLALNLKDNVLRQVQGLSALTKLRILHLDVNHLTDISPISTLPNLVHLSVSTNRLEFLPPLHSSKLIRFEAYHNRIASISPMTLKSMSSLMHLDLGRNKLTEISGTALSQCALLSHLILSQNQLRALPSPLYLPHLRNLWMSGNKLTGMTSWAPEKGKHPVFLPMLEKIYLQDNLIHRIDPHVFVSSPYLAEIDLSFNNLTSLSALDGLRDCKNLFVLQLQENSVNGQSCLPSWLTQHLPCVKEISGAHATHADVVAPTSTSKCMCSYHVAESNLKVILYSQMIEQNLARYRDRHQRTQQQPPLEGRDRAAKYANSDMMYDCRILGARLIDELFEFDGNRSCREVLLYEPEPPPVAIEENTVDRENYHHPEECVAGVSRLQAVYRGRRIRIKLAQLLSDAQYTVDDLDDFSGELLEFDAMMQNIPELDDNWIYNRGDGEVAYPKAPLVYGDHRRRSSALSREAKQAFTEDTFQYKEISTPADSVGFNSRPTSGSTVSSRAHSVASEINNGDITERSSSSNIDDLARDWGLNSDAVLKAMAKRNNRLKRFERSKEKREMDKDPSVRYERFLKTAMSTKGNTQTSGSFGGKPKISRVQKNKKSVPPAWLTMPEET